MKSIANPNFDPEQEYQLFMNWYKTMYNPAWAYFSYIGVWCDSMAIRTGTISVYLKKYGFDNMEIDKLSTILSELWKCCLKCTHE